MCQLIDLNGAYLRHLAIIVCVSKKLIFCTRTGTESLLVKVRVNFGTSYFIERDTSVKSFKVLFTLYKFKYK